MVHAYSKRNQRTLSARGALEAARLRRFKRRLRSPMPAEHDISTAQADVAKLVIAHLFETRRRRSSTPLLHALEDERRHTRDKRSPGDSPNVNAWRACRNCRLRTREAGSRWCCQGALLVTRQSAARDVAANEAKRPADRGSRGRRCPWPFVSCLRSVLPGGRKTGVVQ
jgi:hypothetical protein